MLADLGDYGHSVVPEMPNWRVRRVAFSGPTGHIGLSLVLYKQTLTNLL